MKRLQKKLKPKYGKLTAISERQEWGRRIVLTECACGTRKEVLFDALNSGRVKSCAAHACRYGVFVLPKTDKAYRPHGSRYPEEVVRAMWSRVIVDRESAVAVAEDMAVNKNTLNSILRLVGKCGGIDRYFAIIDKGSDP